MLTTLLVWIYIVALIFVYGISTKVFLEKIFKLKITTVPLVLVLILGLCCITTIASYMNCFIKIGKEFHVLLIILAVIIYFINKKTIKNDLIIYIKELKKTHGLVVFIVILFIFFILIKTTGIRTHIFDFELYHNQAIQWVVNSKIVPGLGNLNIRYIFNSSWLITSAVFSMSFLSANFFYVLNGLLMTLFVIYTSRSLQELITKKVSLITVINTLLLVSSVFYYRKNYSTTAYDLPVFILCLLILILFVEKIKKDECFKFDIYTTLILIYICYVFTIKISIITILFIFGVGVFYELTKKNINRVFKICLISMIIVLPWVIKNILVSGYLVYAFPKLDLFNVDWKVPINFINEILDKRIFVIFRPFRELVDSGISAWWPVWFEHLSIIRKLLVIIISLLHVAYVGVFIARKKLKINFYRYNYFLFPYIQCVIGLIFMFNTVPDFRYHMHYILFIAIYLLSPMVLFIVNKNKKIFTPILISFIIICGFCLIGCSVDYSTIKSRLLYPSRTYLDIPTKQILIKDNIIFHPESNMDERCNIKYWPCTPYKWIDKIELRGTGFAAGFRQKNDKL